MPERDAFAAKGASKAGGGVQVLAVIPPEEFQYRIGVAEIMREEARERIDAHFEVFAKRMRDRQYVDPEPVIREGEAVPEILSQIEEDGEVGLFVLDASPKKGGGTHRDSPVATSWFPASAACQLPRRALERTARPDLVAGLARRAALEWRLTRLPANLESFQIH